jgi:single-stranded-DNA-specific exonuclease
MVQKNQSIEIPPSNWENHPLDDSSLLLREHCSMTRLTAHLIWLKGYRKPDDVSKFLRPSLDDLSNPFELQGMTQIVKRLKKACENQEKILLYGDYDVDGVVGPAILYETLKKKGARVEVYIPDRFKDGYGLNIDVLKKLIKSGAKLVVTIDNGISAIEAIRFLKTKKIDTLVIDHHQPKDELPEAYAILGSRENPLTASGLSFKVAWALDSLDSVKHHLPLAAVGTIADMGNMTGENRIIAKHGLSEMPSTENKGLRALLKQNRLDQKAITPESISFLIAPRINALGRIGSAKDAFQLLVTDNGDEAANLSQLLDEANRQRQKVEAETYNKITEQVKREHNFDKEPVIVVSGLRWHEGVVGILATRLVEKFSCPSIVIALQEKTGKGSGRSITGFSLYHAMKSCEDLLERFGGHHAACGFTIKPDNVKAFKERINEIALREMSQKQKTPSLFIDAEIDLDDLTLRQICEIENLGPFGIQNTRPVFLSRSLRVNESSVAFGRGGCRFGVESSGGNRSAEVVSYRRKFKVKTNDRVDLVYAPAMHHARGREILRLNLLDLRI